jgi:hypothetical protein
MGCVKFNQYDTAEPFEPLYLKFDVDEQTALGRTTSDSTLEWWSKQSAEAQEEAFSEEGRISLDEVTRQLNKYIVGADKIFADGTTFDILILENLYRMIGKPVPWQYWQIRDARTIYDLGDDSAKTGNSSAHNALADSYYQAIAVQNIYKELNIKKKEK